MQVAIMTARYADAASELRNAMYAFGEVVDVIPTYGNASPWRSVKVRLAIREHHEACKNEKKKKGRHHRPRQHPTAWGQGGMKKKLGKGRTGRHMCVRLRTLR